MPALEEGAAALAKPVPVEPGADPVAVALLPEEGTMGEPVAVAETAPEVTEIRPVEAVGAMAVELPAL